MYIYIYMSPHGMPMYVLYMCIYEHMSKLDIAVIGICCTYTDTASIN